ADAGRGKLAVAELARGVGREIRGDEAEDAAKDGVVAGQVGFDAGADDGRIQGQHADAVAEGEVAAQRTAGDEVVVDQSEVARALDAGFALLQGQGNGLVEGDVPGRSFRIVDV